MSAIDGPELRERPAGELLKDLSQQTGTLVRQEVELAKAELAALIVFVVYVALASVFAVLGRSRIRKAAPPAPEQTIETVKEDVQWAKTRARSGRT